MELKELIEREIKFIKERIDEYQKKSKEADSLALTFYYDGLVVAFQTTLSELEFLLEVSKTEK